MTATHIILFILQLARTALEQYNHVLEGTLTEAEFIKRWDTMVVRYRQASAAWDAAGQ